MKIQDLFAKPIERPIEGVIKADDDRYLQTEVEEYVVTREIAHSLPALVDCYLEQPSANGVWISGFFGSGKSHLLKMLSLLLDGRPLPDGKRPADLLLPKIDDAILRGDLHRAVKIPARSLLFNIDQKSDNIGGDKSSAVLEVFVKVMNELQGYYAQQGHIAQFEYELDARGQLSDFKQTYARISGRSWEEDLPVLDTLENATFAEAYAAHFKKPVEDGAQLFDRLRANYKVSIETFAQRVKAYIDKQPAGFRLNFFVDEAGQFIGQHSQLMLNLQTIAESLSTVCQGRAWVFVTSQGDLQKVLGELKVGVGQDFSKIQGRFKTRLTLTSADVREVIQKRLLAKRVPEPAPLVEIYDAEKENLQTLFRFGDGSFDFKRWRGSDEFCAYYPFVPYQFELFQRAIEQLSGHNAFTGKYTAVGERSMLAVFQDVAKTLRGEPVGKLATFDLMFDGIAATLRGDIQTSIQQAATQLSSPLAVRALKALFLLKWVKEFKPTARNVAILLIDRPEIEIQAHEKAVREALNLLESQSYLQRNGDVFEFLTDVEKDIEVEIKNTDIDDAQLTRELSDILFADVLRENKIRHEGNGVFYEYVRKLDDQPQSRDAEIAVNIVTPDHENYEQPAVLAAQNMGKPELLLLLPADTRVIDDTRLFLKTRKYVQQNTGASQDESRKAILEQRGQQNSARRTALMERCRELLGRASFYLNGSPLLIAEGDARNRFARAGQELIAHAFSNLKMLRGTYDEAQLAKTLLQPDDLLASGEVTLSEAEQEVLTYIQRNQNEGERTSVESIVRQFGRRPFGWPLLATVTQIARLFRAGKIELRAAELLDARKALDALKNSRQHGSVKARLQVSFDPAKVNALKRFYQDFFDRQNDGADARSVGQRTADDLAAEAKALGALQAQAASYPFLSQLKPVIALLEQHANQGYAYLLDNRALYAEKLLDAKETLLAPLKAFMNGPQRVTYDEVRAFYREEQANFGELAEADLAPVRKLVESAEPYRGNLLPQAKAALNKLRAQIADKLAAARDEALVQLQAYEDKLNALPDVATLSDAQRAELLRATHEARAAVREARFISGVRDRLQRYAAQEFTAQLALAHRLAAPPPAPTGDGTSTQTPPQPKYVKLGDLPLHMAAPYISSEAELDAYLSALRAAAAAELARGNRLLP